MKYSIKLRPAEQDGYWILEEPFTYEDITVPAGFVSDLSSIPWGFQWLIPKGGPKAAAAIVHDYLYQTGKVSRKEADEIFLKIMREQEVAAWKRYAMYGAVRLFGSNFYAA